MRFIIEILRDPLWSPYAIGFGIGLLSWLMFLLANRPLGISTAFSKCAGILEKNLRGTKTTGKPYYQEHPPTIDPELLLLVGIFFGAGAAALASGTVRWEWVPSMWAEAFGPSVGKRLAVATVGGILLGFGARWAGGCTSGHGISGAMQLVLSSWLAALCFFVGGVATALLLYSVV